MHFLAGKPITQNGLGLMRLNLPPIAPDEQIFKVLRKALEQGMNVWNGADYYGTAEANSLHLMSRYFAQYPEDAEKVVLCIKTGQSSDRSGMDCSPAALRKSIDNALKILDGKKTIDVFGITRVDPNVPVEESVKALAEFKQEGKIGGIQLSEVRAETIRRAVATAKIDMVEAEVSLWSLEVFENGVAQVCAENDIVLVAHTPLGSGFLTGQVRSIDDFPPNSPWRFLPRFQPENIAQNNLLLDAIEEIAKAKNCTTAQLALNWIKQQSKRAGMPLFVPVGGARSEDRVVENSTDIELSDDDLTRIDEILKKFPPSGERAFPQRQKFSEY